MYNTDKLGVQIVAFPIQKKIRHIKNRIVWKDENKSVFLYEGKHYTCKMPENLPIKKNYMQIDIYISYLYMQCDIYPTSHQFRFDMESFYSGGQQENWNLWVAITKNENYIQYYLNQSFLLEYETIPSWPPLSTKQNISLFRKALVNRCTMFLFKIIIEHDLQVLKHGFPTFSTRRPQRFNREGLGLQFKKDPLQKKNKEIHNVRIMIYYRDISCCLQSQKDVLLGLNEEVNWRSKSEK